jgi:D-hexose-6-phosphate mutarotase
MSFTAALHTYFAASAIEGVTVEGLSGVTYTDSLAGGARVVQEGPVVFDREVDRIYLAAPDAAMKVRHEKEVDGCVSTRTVFEKMLWVATYMLLGWLALLWCRV